MPNRKSTARYVRRPVPARTRRRLTNHIQNFRREVSWNFGDRHEIEITLPNKVNPNGIYARSRLGEPIEVGRFINLAWAKRHGYDQ